MRDVRSKASEALQTARSDSVELAKERNKCRFEKNEGIYLEKERKGTLFLEETKKGKIYFEGKKKEEERREEE